MLNNWSVYLDCAIAGAKSIRPLGAEFGEDEDEERRFSAMITSWA